MLTGPSLGTSTTLRTSGAESLAAPQITHERTDERRRLLISLCRLCDEGECGRARVGCGQLADSLRQSPELNFPGVAHSGERLHVLTARQYRSVARTPRVFAV
jgi:hypothetical protein